MLEHLYAQLTAYLDNKISIEELQKWFVPATWNVAEMNDPICESTVKEIDIRLIEFSMSHLDESELRNIFSRIVSRRIVRLSSAPISSSGGLVAIPTPVHVVVVDIQLSKACL